VAVALAGDNRRHHAVEEIAVVADQQHRAGVIGQLLLQQVERLQIEIVGRLVENQQVRRAGEGAGQGEPGSLAAGQYADRGAGLLGRNRKSFM